MTCAECALCNKRVECSKGDKYKKYLIKPCYCRFAFRSLLMQTPESDLTMQTLNKIASLFPFQQPQFLDHFECTNRTLHFQTLLSVNTLMHLFTQNIGGLVQRYVATCEQNSFFFFFNNLMYKILAH